MPTPTKSQNTTIVGSRDLDSTQLSHPSRFCHRRPLCGNNDYTPFKSTTQNQNLFLRKYFYLLPTQAQKKHILQLGINGNPAKRDLHKIMGKIRYHYFQNWHLKIVQKTKSVYFFNLSYRILMADHFRPFSDFIISISI